MPNNSTTAWHPDDEMTALHDLADCVERLIGAGDTSAISVNIHIGVAINAAERHGQAPTNVSGAVAGQR